MENIFSPPVLYIETYDDQGRRHSSGSGTLIRFLDNKDQECNLIVTCLHVINLSQVTLQLSKDIRVWRPKDAFIPERTYYKAEVITHGALTKSDGEDLALLKIEGNLEIAGISSYLLSQQIEEYLPLYFYGYPLGRQRFEERPCLVVLKREETKIATKPGNSIYLVDYPLTARGVSGGAVFCQNSQKLVGIWRGKWKKEAGYRLIEDNYAEGVIIGLHWVKELCEKAGYKFEKKSVFNTNTININNTQEKREAKAEIQSLEQDLDAFIRELETAIATLLDPYHFLVDCRRSNLDGYFICIDKALRSRENLEILIQSRINHAQYLIQELKKKIDIENLPAYPIICSLEFDSNRTSDIRLDKNTDLRVLKELKDKWCTDFTFKKEIEFRFYSNYRARLVKELNNFRNLARKFIEEWGIIPQKTECQDTRRENLIDCSLFENHSTNLLPSGNMEKKEKGKIKLMLEILKKVSEGIAEFQPNSTDTSLESFQSIAQCLLSAERKGYIGKLIPHKTSFHGKLYIDRIYIIEGLTYEGEIFLENYR